MRAALCELLRCWQNNVKIAVDGEAVLPPTHSAAHEAGMQDALKFLFPDEQDTASRDAFVGLLVVRVATPLHGLLARLLAAAVACSRASTGL